MSTQAPSETNSLIHFKCPMCGERLKTDRKFARRTTLCIKCQSEIRVPLHSEPLPRIPTVEEHLGVGRLKWPMVVIALIMFPAKVLIIHFWSQSYDMHPAETVWDSAFYDPGTGPYLFSSLEDWDPKANVGLERVWYLNGLLIHVPVRHCGFVWGLCSHRDDSRACRWQSYPGGG